MEEERRKRNITNLFLTHLWHKRQGTIDSFAESAGPLSKSRKFLSDTAFRLENSEVIKEVSRKKSGKKVVKKFKLTVKGMMRAFRLVTEKSSLKKLVGERRIIVFDIPEEQRFYRDYFRQVMKDLDCRRIQLSVWEADFELPEDFHLLVKELGLKHCVIVYCIKPQEIIYL